MCLGESNRHIVRRIVGLGGVHGGYSVGQTNVGESNVLCAWVSLIDILLGAL